MICITDELQGEDAGQLKSRIRMHTTYRSVDRLRVGSGSSKGSSGDEGVDEHLVDVFVCVGVVERG